VKWKNTDIILYCITVTILTYVTTAYRYNWNIRLITVHLISSPDRQQWVALFIGGHVRSHTTLRSACYISSSHGATTFPPPVVVGVGKEMTTLLLWFLNCTFAELEDPLVELDEWFCPFVVVVVVVSTACVGGTSSVSPPCLELVCTRIKSVSFFLRLAGDILQ